MTNAPKKPIIYLDLDAVLPEQEVSVKLKGVSHSLAPITLEDFILNAKKVQESAVDTDPAAELIAVRDMLGRSFPTIPKDVLREITLIQLNALLDFAMQHNGSSRVNAEAAADAAADPKPAGE